MIEPGIDAVFLPGKIHGCEWQAYIIYFNDCAGDYTKSDVRTYCNGEFYNELCNAVGKDNIIPHGVDG